MSQDTNLLNYVLIFRVGAQMDVIFVDFPKENPWNNPSIEYTGEECADPVELDRNDWSFSRMYCPCFLTHVLNAKPCGLSLFCR